MSWFLLLLGAAAVGSIPVFRAIARSRARSNLHRSYPHRPGAERRERPHREIAHYRASGALPRWDR
jgi:hypothetical protein